MSGAVTFGARSRGMAIGRSDAAGMSFELCCRFSGAAAAMRYVRERFDAGEYAMYEEDGYCMLLYRRAMAAQMDP